MIGHAVASTVDIVTESFYWQSSQCKQGLHLPCAAHLHRQKCAVGLCNRKAHTESFRGWTCLCIQVCGDGEVTTCVLAREQIILVTVVTLNPYFCNKRDQILLEIRRGENQRSQNRTSKTGFASPILGPEIEQSLIYY